jgi:hypothetical protein
VNLQTRSSENELMDDGSLDTEEYARCLGDLARLNRVTLTHRATLHWLTRAVGAAPPAKPVAIFDVAYGNGDLLRAIHHWAARRGIPVVLSGIDLNPRAVEVARGATPLNVAIDFRRGDVFDHIPDPRPDYIVSSQFTHHLTNDGVVRFLMWMERHTDKGWFIADLHRHAIPYYGFRFLARTFGWHRIVRIDGTISIARSFRRADWQRLLAKARISGEIRWHFPFRLCVGRIK